MIRPIPDQGAYRQNRIALWSMVGAARYSLTYQGQRHFRYFPLTSGLFKKKSLDRLCESCVEVEIGEKHPNEDYKSVWLIALETDLSIILAHQKK